LRPSVIKLITLIIIVVVASITQAIIRIIARASVIRGGKRS
jgi:hypothetical protein